jgi:hypothetical protein
LNVSPPIALILLENEIDWREEQRSNALAPNSVTLS